MGQGSGQCQPLCLTAGQTDGTAADDGLHSRLHVSHFPIQAGAFQVVHGASVIAAQNVCLHRVVPKLRVMPQISNDACTLSVVQPA